MTKHIQAPRLSPGFDLSEALAGLSVPARHALNSADEARKNSEDAKANHERWTGIFRRRIVDAMNAGVPVQVLSRVFGITPGRVYQIRAEVEEGAAR